jgi:hypothetical protein
MKIIFTLFGIMLFVIGCHHRNDCSNVGNVLNWRQNNFTTIVPAEKYRLAGYCLLIKWKTDAGFRFSPPCGPTGYGLDVKIGNIECV